MIKIILWLICFVLSVSAYTHGNSPFDNKDIYFYGEMPDAAALGMAGAYGASSGHPFAAYWNPAGIANVRGNMFAFSANVAVRGEGEVEEVRETLPLEGRGINFVSIAAPEVGIYYRRLSNRIDENDDYTDGRVSIFGLTVGLAQDERTDFGMNLNYIAGMAGYYQEGETRPEISAGYGWGLDWGIIYKASPQLNIGLTLHNAPAYIYWEEWDSDQLPLLFRGGVKLRFTQLMSAGVFYESGGFKDEKIKESDLLRFGVEQVIHESVVARAGVYGPESAFDDRYSLVYTAGIGYQQEKYSLDIALKRYYFQKDSSSRTDRYSLSGVIPF